MLQKRSLLVRGVVTLAALLLACLPARAHPHVFVTVEATLLYENGAFTGITHKWTFDETYTAMAIEGLDKNKDGKYDRDELEELAKVNIDALKDFEYFTYPTLAGQPVKLGTPRDYWLEHKDGLLSLHFTVPFAAPVLTDAKGFAFSIFDSSYFIAFEAAKTPNPIRLGPGAPKGCRLAAAEPEQRDTAAFGAMAQLGGVVNLGKSFAVECSGE